MATVTQWLTSHPQPDIRISRRISVRRKSAEKYRHTVSWNV